jgi:hypothetical protein
MQQQQAKCSMVTDTALVFPTWLTSCRLPTVEQVLEPQKFLGLFFFFSSINTL